MKHLLLLIFGLLLSLSMMAQQFIDIVHLKNGGMIRGIIIEQIPSESLKIQTADGSIFVYQMSDVEKITKEFVQQQQPQQQQPQQQASAQSSDDQAKPKLDGHLSWEDGYLYYNGLRLADQQEGRLLMTPEMWERYSALNNSYRSWEVLNWVGIGLAVAGSVIALGGLIAGENDVMIVGGVGAVAGYVLMIPPLVARQGIRNRIDPIMNESNYSRTYSLDPHLDWEPFSQPKANTNYTLAMIPSYRPLFRCAVRF